MIYNNNENNEMIINNPIQMILNDPIPSESLSETVSVLHNIRKKKKLTS